MRLFRRAYKQSAFSRRDFLRGVVGATGITLLPGCLTGSDACYSLPAADSPMANADWLRTARIGGLAAFAGASVCDLRADLDRMADERVSVVELDPELSNYLNEEGFQDQLRLVDAVSRECHKRGMRCIAYYPTLESLTPDANNVASTMFKDHPDWVQLSMDGMPNTFVGGEGRVFWVDPGVESSWLCPTSGYVDYFVGRVKRLAETALDGLWGDVPLLSDIVGVWPCVNASCNAKFHADTGLVAPTAADWNDPTFVKWVVWRHRLIYEMEQRIVTAAKSVRADFEVIIETVTMDYNGATSQGLDGAAADDGLLHRVWEVDAASDASSMRFATEDDWWSMAAMMKHARGSSEPRPAWCFCYGLEPDDAEPVMALCIASGCNPYETKIPQMCTSAGSAYRKRMYSWLADHPGLLLSRSANQTAIIYSSVSRDMVDRARGTGLYTSYNPSDQLWWSELPNDTAKSMEYIADFRGMVKLLFRQHVPFDVVTTPHATSEKLALYRYVALPSPASLDAALVGRLRDYVTAGGSLLFTGPSPGGADETGLLRGKPLLLEALGLKDLAPGWTELTVGAGRILYTEERAGAVFFNDGSAAISAMGVKLAPGQLETNAPPGIVCDLRRADTGELLAIFANLDGLGSQGTAAFTPRPASFTCAVAIGTARILRVIVTRPDAGAQDAEVPFLIAGGKVRFDVSIQAAAAAIIVFA